ncbi:MAG: ABC transporter permease subunit [Chloroflexota bacterium]|nr:ABC transporter permease subunit [Chloroflexota bacterium]MDE2883596.1 ABC transporter permease subunit [Chloroflexota bacterium]
MQERLPDTRRPSRLPALLARPLAVAAALGAGIWYRNTYRHLVINVAVGGFAAVFVFYIASSVYAANFFDFDFLFEPYGSPDRSSIFPGLNVEAGDPRWQAILKGAGNTLSVVLFAIGVSSFLGLLIGVARLTPNPLLSRVAKLYVELFRNLPLLLIMFFFAFAMFRELPQIQDRAGLNGVLFISNRGMAVPWLEAANGLWPFWVIALAFGIVAASMVRGRRMRQENDTGQSTHPNAWGAATLAGVAVVSYFALLMPVRITLPEVVQAASGFYSYDGGNVLRLGYVSALISLSLYFSAFIAEIVRGSIQAIPRGQSEAAAALGLSAYQQLTLIILPQALRIMIPTLNNEYQNTNKDSTLAHAIAYGEIVLISNRIVNNEGSLLQTYFFIFVVFVLTNLVISFIMNTINRNVQVK